MEATTNGLAVQEKVSLIRTLAARYSVDPEVFKQVVLKTCMPPNASNEDFCAFLVVCHEHDLNPMLREIFAIIKKGGGIQAVVGIDGWVKIVNRHAQLDGFEFDMKFDDAHKKPVSCTCKMWRKDRSRHSEVTEYFSECYRDTDPWKNMPARMLRHKAMIQCARYTFGFAGLMDEDEAETIKQVDGRVVEDIPGESRTEAIKRQLKQAAPALSEPTPNELAGASTQGHAATQQEPARRGRKPKEQSAAPQGEQSAPLQPKAQSSATQTGPGASEQKTSGGSPPVATQAAVSSPATTSGGASVTTPAAPKETGEIFSEWFLFTGSLDIGQSRTKFLNDRADAFYSESVISTAELKGAIADKRKMYVSWVEKNGRNIIVDAKHEGPKE